MAPRKRKEPAEKIDLNRARTPAAIRPPKNKPGPRKAFNPEWLQTIGQLAMLGMINDQIADFYGVTDTTFDNWIRDIPELKAVLVENREMADAKVASSLFRRAVGYEYVEEMEEKGPDGRKRRVTTKHVPGDVNAQSLWLRNRRPQQFRDKQPELQMDETPLQRIEIAVVGAADVKKANGEE